MNAIGSIRPADPFHHTHVPVVAIPVCNEAGNIGACLTALADQTFRQDFAVLLLLNNCTDGTDRVVAGMDRSFPFSLRVKKCLLPPALANAGSARRLVMDLANSLTDGILLTTDADSRPSKNWLSANLDAIASGADAVAGRAEIDPVDAARLPVRLLDDEARVQLFITLLDRIDSLLDPDPTDPWPRHTQHSGASIAVTAECYRRAGGLPSIPLGEDRAFFERLRCIDARIRHAPEAVVTVSGRLVGRAKGGMADTMRRRLAHADPWLDDCTESAAIRANRAAARAIARRIWARIGASLWDGRSGENDIADLASRLQLTVATVAALLQARNFGAGWAMLETRSLSLRRDRLAASELEAEMAAAVAILDQIEASASALSAPPKRLPFSANHSAASVNASSPAG